MITQYRGFNIDLSNTKWNWAWSAVRDDGKRIEASSLPDLRARIDLEIDGAPKVASSAEVAAAAAEVDALARRIAGVLTALDSNDEADQMARRIAGVPPGDAVR